KGRALLAGGAPHGQPAMGRMTHHRLIGSTAARPEPAGPRRRWALGSGPGSAVGLRAPLEPLYEHRHAHAAGDAHRLDAVGAVERFEIVDQGGHDPRAGHAEGVPQRDGPAEGVELLVVDPEILLA